MRFSFYSTLAVGALFAADQTKAFNLESQNDDEQLLAQINTEENMVLEQDLYSLLA